MEILILEEIVILIVVLVFIIDIAKIFFLDNSNELQKPNNFKINYSIGKYWDLYNDTTDKPTSIYLDGMVKEWFDHTFSNFGDPCTKYNFFILIKYF